MFGQDFPSNIGDSPGKEQPTNSVQAVVYLFGVNSLFPSWNTYF